MHKILIICGPTATGKTALALKLAAKFKGAIISADSRQVYRGMDIGTGKDIPADFKAVSYKLDFNHQSLTVYRSKSDLSIWGYDLVDPDQSFSAAAFYRFVWTIIPALWSSGHLPILVGGTGLYLKCIVSPPATLGIPPNLALRQTLATLPLSELQHRLRQLNPDRWQTMNASDRANPRRLVRAIEVTTLPPVTLPVLPSLKILWLGLQGSLSRLDLNINRRVQARAGHKFTLEIRRLERRYPAFASLSAAGALGYREWLSYLNGHLSRTAAIERWQSRERQYARRQITWFNQEKAINWFSIEAPQFPLDVVAKVKTWYADV